MLELHFSNDGHQVSETLVLITPISSCAVISKSRSKPLKCIEWPLLMDLNQSKLWVDSSLQGYNKLIRAIPTCLSPADLEDLSCNCKRK